MSRHSGNALVVTEMHQCENCGSAVTDDFARVFGTNANRVFACPECATMRDIMAGEAAVPEQHTSLPVQ